jgi:y4mF family transcriptional regulator
MIMHLSRSKLDITAAVAQEFGQIVLQQRKRLGLRQDELALAAGVSTRVIHQIEAGKATSRLDSLVPVLDALGMGMRIEPGPARVPGGEAQ